MNTHRRNQLPSHVASHYAIAPSYEPEPPRKKKGGSVKHLTFLGDSSQFGRLDKEMLGKAVQEALVDAGLADTGAEDAQPAETESADFTSTDAASANTQENE